MSPMSLSLNSAPSGTISPSPIGTGQSYWGLLYVRYNLSDFFITTAMAERGTLSPLLQQLPELLPLPLATGENNKLNTLVGSE
jgi:hypothetical protein